MTNLATYRQNAKMSQRQLAELAGCSDGMIASIETGVRKPGPQLALRIAKAVDAKVADVFPDLADFFNQMRDGGVA